MIDKMREEFEAAWADVMRGDDPAPGRKPLRSLIEPDRYRGDAVNFAWAWWQRSRESLPSIHPIQQTLRDNGDLIALRATVAQQAQMIEHLRGGATPDFTAIDMGTASADGRRSLAEYLIKQIAIEHPDQDTLLTVKHIAQWIALEAGL